ncbi:hypothetical protein CKF59_05670 [Psittacicella gerlachiana]|uniref:Uncharacterized protein n=1 Tax=Psittacicella gerlachiana TaxID=2028574 RepID=A0A3A1YAP2_9GAMM|nr:hypothetical protein [Psittacicella gerlachiana]RIY34299.1 hypothetical protein CKF59_05670 [Psittacicella gerlachiana]
MAFESHNMQDYLAWSKEQDFAPKFKLETTKIYDLFANLDEEAQQDFLNSWQQQLKQKCLYLDIAIPSSPLQSLQQHLLHSTHQNELPSTHLGIIYGSKNKLPLNYTWHSDSLGNDKVFAFMLEAEEKLVKDTSIFVLDSQDLTLGTFSLFKQNQINFLTEVNKDSAFFTESLQKSLAKNWEYNELNLEHRIFYREIKSEYLQNPVKLFIYKDKYRATLEEDCLLQNLFLSEEEKNYLQACQKLSSLDNIDNQAMASNYISKETNHRGKNFEDKSNLENCELQNQATSKRGSSLIPRPLQNQLQQCGHFILISNQMDLNSTQALEAYKYTNLSQAFFTNLRSELEITSSSLSKEKITQGKLFVAFLALILRQSICNKLESNSKTRDFTFSQIRNELNRIRKVKLQQQTQLQPLTERQKLIAQVLDVKF